jgi:hypothetical protein
VILQGFEHRPGVHCGTTALADALRIQGVHVSEAMAFGLGAGLGFYYLVSPALTPTHLFCGRTLRLEETACEVLGVPVHFRTEDDPALAWAGVRAAIDRGIAPIVATELSELPYWRTRTRFGGHRVVVAGYDLDRRVALVADNDRAALEEVPLDDLERARATIAPPFALPGRPWIEVGRPVTVRPLADAVADALRRQAREYLIDVDGSAGISALERFAAELPGWATEASSEEDRAWCFRYAYQVIDRRGTGGGNFRTLYARFLEEAEALLPGLAAGRLSGPMHTLAAGWSRLADMLRALSEARGASVPPEVTAHVRALARDERRYHEDVAALIR